jgi:RNA polymerase sigma-70 factor (ECF subfamily)
LRLKNKWHGINSVDFRYFSAKYFRINGLKEDYTYHDRELFKRIALGDEMAFTKVYYRYTEQLFSYIVKLTGYELWAEEIAHDVLLKIWENRTALKDVENPSGYLFRMAANKTLDHIKHHAVETKMQHYLTGYGQAEGRNFTEEKVYFRISEQLYKEALNKLPAQRQLVYRLKNEEGLSYYEIADRLQISKHTVRNHLAEATQAIRIYLLEKGGILLLIMSGYHYL